MKRTARCRMCGAPVGDYGFWRRLFGAHPRSCVEVDVHREDECIERFRVGRGLRRP